MAETLDQQRLVNGKVVLINYEPMPSTISFGTGDKGIDGFIERINLGKKIYVDIHLKGKTEVTVSLRAKGVGLTTSTYNSPTNPFKMKVVNEHNWYTSNYRNIYYFKLSKKQGLKQLEEYIRDMVSQVFNQASVEETIINLVIWDNRNVRQIRETYPGL
jgi:hypothetical protein